MLPDIVGLCKQMNILLGYNAVYSTFDVQWATRRYMPDSKNSSLTTAVRT
jgi:hypothetical protein